MNRTALASIAALGLLLSSALASADDDEKLRLYGVGAGVSFDLDPADSVGAAVSASAAMRAGEEGPFSLLWLRGRLTGMFTGSSWAVIPTLSGSVGAEIGPIELFLDGGVHIFGVANRGAETIFAMFGLAGGGGFAINIQNSWRIGIQATINWLPSFLSAPIDKPDETPDQTFLFFSTSVIIEFAS